MPSSGPVRPNARLRHRHHVSRGVALGVVQRHHLRLRATRRRVHRVGRVASDKGARRRLAHVTKRRHATIHHRVAQRVTRRTHRA